MASNWQRNLLRPIPYVLTDWVGTRLLRLSNKALTREFCGQMTDDFFELLLRGMDLAFCLCKDYRKNIKDFNGKYLFRTIDGSVMTSAVFSNGDMKVLEHGIDDWDVMVQFKDAQALNRFLLSQDQDILNSLLKNEVEVHGNANYVYRYGFLARDLGRRLGVG
jgi:hypothetical protein